MPSPPVSVLVVESHDTLRQTLCLLLQGRGLGAVGASSGAVALRMLRRGRPSAIVLELRLREMSGIDLIRHIREQPALRQVPILALTVVSDRALHETARQAGCTAVLEKPLHADDLVDLVRGLSAAPAPALAAAVP